MTHLPDEHTFIPIKFVRDGGYPMNSPLDYIKDNPRKTWVVSACECGAIKKEEASYESL